MAELKLQTVQTDGPHSRSEPCAGEDEGWNMFGMLMGSHSKQEA